MLNTVALVGKLVDIPVISNKKMYFCLYCRHLLFPQNVSGILQTIFTEDIFCRF